MKYKYFISYFAINEKGMSISGNCANLRKNKIKTLEDIREIEENLCIENNFDKVNINNFIEFK